MGPAPDTDVEDEEEEVDKMDKAGEVVDIDDGIENLLMETSLSQQSDYGDTQDLDSILRPLSESQKLREEELDRVDQRIKEEGHGANLEEVCPEKAPEQLPTLSRMTRTPPGMTVFKKPPTLVYRAVSLEADLDWTGRARLLAAGLSDAMVNEMLGSPRLFAVKLAPSVGQSRFYATPEEFCKVADFLFYNACTLEEAQEHAVVRRSLLDLLKYCGLPWKLTSLHILTALLNLGLDPTLQRSNLVSQVSPQDVSLPNESLPDFYHKHTKDKQNVSTESFRTILGNTLKLVGTLFTLPERSGLHPTSPSLMSMFLVLGLDPVVIESSLLQRHLTKILHSLLDLCPASSLDTFLQDVTEVVLTKAPRLLGQTTFHPHNVSHLCSLMPSSLSGCRLRRIFAYFGLQVGLGLKEPDLPWEASVFDLWSCLSKHRERWRSVSKKQHYVTRHLVGLMDHIYSGELPPSSGHWEPLRSLLGLLEEYKDRAPRLDALNLDPTIAADAAAELGARWTLALNAAENQANLSFQAKVFRSQSQTNSDI